MGLFFSFMILQVMSPMGRVSRRLGLPRHTSGKWQGIWDDRETPRCHQKWRYAVFEIACEPLCTCNSCLLPPTSTIFKVRAAELRVHFSVEASVAPHYLCSLSGGLCSWCSAAEVSHRPPCCFCRLSEVAGGQHRTPAAQRRLQESPTAPSAASAIFAGFVGASTAQCWAAEALRKPAEVVGGSVRDSCS